LVHDEKIKRKKGNTTKTKLQSNKPNSHGVQPEGVIVSPAKGIL